MEQEVMEDLRVRHSLGRTGMLDVPLDQGGQIVHVVGRHRGRVRSRSSK